ncbi:MAG: hypothetical protein J6N21_01265, partial [Butyrivibrio sp.]|nr:hypothetical protein [Butyrivibrio sp.]
LGCEQQSLLITYYWLKEALKYQSPKAVVLETYTFHKYTDAYVYNNMNCSEGAVRKPMDSMRLSPLKWEAGMAIEKVDPTQIGLSFPLLNIRYHTRWTGLGENDYTESSMIDHGGVKGFTVIGGKNPEAVDAIFKDSECNDVEPEPMVEIADEYLWKIINLCKEKNIQLIMANIPYGEPKQRYKSTKEYAVSHGIPYYDFNEEKLYHEINYSVSENLYGHPNYLGAEKISMYMGNLLVNEYGIQKREDSSYEATRELFQHKVENINLKDTTDIHKYIDMLNNSRYDVFILGSNNIGGFIDEDIMNKLHSLGFKSELRGVSENTHYCAAKSPSGISEELTAENIKSSGSVRNGLTPYTFTIDTSAMIPRGHTYSLNISGTECGSASPGLNFIVYDDEQKMIIDKVNFNTSVAELTATRY